MTDSVFDGAPWQASGSGACAGKSRGPDHAKDGADSFDTVELVDASGLPILPPEHTEQELAAILATNPLNDPAFAAECASRDVGPDGLAGQIVSRTELLLEDLHDLEPGVALAASLADLTGSGTGPDVQVTDSELRSVVSGWEQVISWARAAQARASAELMARTDDPLSRDSTAGEIAGDLHVTTGEGWQIATRGEGTTLYPQLDQALTLGKVDTKKADTLLRAGADLTVAERGEAITELLPAAPKRTWRWISEQMNARAATLHGRKARRREVVDRCNVWAEQAGPGMGRLVADLPVVETARAFNTVQAAAKALKDVPGETRPLGALRAAALTALVTGGLVLPCSESDSENGSDSETGTTAGTDTGVSAEAEAGVDAVVEDPPHLTEPVLDTDLVPLPADPHSTALTGPAPAGVRESTGRGGGAPATQIRVVEVSTCVNVTVPATMLLDPDDMTPGILEDIGPIPADVAARIAADATWRRLLTDPTTGVLTDYSTRTYTPGITLRAAVVARDQACRFPGCHRPATTGGRASVDLDHIEPFDADHPYRPGEPGQTRAANLHPLCRKHHNLKTHARWNATRDPDTGTTYWTAPTSMTNTVDPTITDPTIRYALAHGMTLADPSGTRPDSSAPGSTPAGNAPPDRATGDGPTGQSPDRHPEDPPF